MEFPLADGSVETGSGTGGGQCRPTVIIPIRRTQRLVQNVLVSYREKALGFF